MKNMKKCVLLFALWFLALDLQAQFVKSLNHFSKANSYQTFVHVGQNNQIEVIQATNVGGDVKITTSTLDNKGEIVSFQKFEFNLGISISDTIGLTGVFDENNIRTLMLDFYGPNSKKMGAISYSKTTGDLIAYSEFNDIFKLSHIKAIRNGNELVQYAQATSGALKRIAFDINNISNVNAEIIDYTSITGFSLFHFKNRRTVGEIELVNGKEISTFLSNVPLIYKRVALNDYSIHSFNALPPNSASLEPIGNNELIYFSGKYILKLDENLNQIDSIHVYQGTLNGRQATLKSYQNSLYLMTSFNLSGETELFRYDYDLNLIEMRSFTVHSRMLDSPKLQIVNNQLLLSGNYVEATYNTSMDGVLNFQLKPVYLNLFSQYPTKFNTNELRFNREIDSLTYDFGLGNNFVIYDYYPPIRTKTLNQSIAFLINNQFVGISGLDTLGKNTEGYLHDYLPGPYTNPNLYTDGISNKYALAFFVSREMIENHLDSIQSGSSTYIPPHGIKHWPAHGNTAIGQAENLAPFVDVNDNGIYEPYQGDYPSIYGTHSIFSITHQNPNISKTAGIEVQSYIYWFEYDTTDNFVHVVFHKNRLISRTTNFDEFRVGTYADFDIGGYADDYIGTNVALSTVYAYNGDNNDEPYYGNLGFGENLPIAGIITLKGAKKVNDGMDNPGPYYDQNSGQIVVPTVATALANNGTVYKGLGLGHSDGIIDNEYYGLENSFFYTNGNAPNSSDPYLTHEWYNYFSGKNRFGNPIYFGGTGSYSPSTIESKYVFTGSSDSLHWSTDGVDPGFIWSEETTNNPAGDRRLITSTGKQSLAIGEAFEYEIAFIFRQLDSASSNPDSIFTVFFNSCDSVITSYQRSALDGGIFDPIPANLTVEEKSKPTFLLYPNPTSNTITIAAQAGSIQSISLFDLNGKQLSTKQVNGQETQLDVSHLEAGIYLVRIEMPNGETTMKRFVKK